MDTKKEVKFADLNSIEPSKMHVNLAFEHEDDQTPKSMLNDMINNIVSNYLIAFF